MCMTGNAKHGVVFVYLYWCYLLLFVVAVSCCIYCALFIVSYLFVWQEALR